MRFSNTKSKNYYLLAGAVIFVIAIPHLVHFPALVLVVPQAAQ
jgi:hypothetical protein